MARVNFSENADAYIVTPVYNWNFPLQLGSLNKFQVSEAFCAAISFIVTTHGIMAGCTFVDAIS